MSQGGTNKAEIDADAKSVRQEKLIPYLLSYPTITAAAEASGIPERTCRRWLAEDQSFRDQYHQARRAVFLGSMGRIQRTTAKAAVALEELIDNSFDDRVRLTTARTILENAIRWHEIEELNDRLQKIEDILLGDSK